MTIKQAYFTSENITFATQEMLKRVSGEHVLHPFQFKPAQSALLLLDLQAYFLDPCSPAFLPAAPAILPKLASLLQAATDKDLPMFQTRHVNTPEDAGNMGTWWRRLISPDDPLSQLRLASPMSQVIEKTQYDAFHGTHLEAQLCQLGIRQVIIGGLMTHLCCETTARSAFVRGFEVIFLLDGTATYSREYHLATLLNLSQGFASLAACDEIINLISGDPRK